MIDCSASKHAHTRIHEYSDAGFHAHVDEYAKSDANPQSYADPYLDAECHAGTVADAGRSGDPHAELDPHRELDADAGWDAKSWQAALEPYFEEHNEIGTGPDARGPHLMIIDYQPDRWVVRQILDDPAGHHDLAINAEVDLPASDDTGTAALRITTVAQL